MTQIESIDEEDKKKESKEEVNDSEDNEEGDYSLDDDEEDEDEDEEEETPKEEVVPEEQPKIIDIPSDKKLTSDEWEQIIKQEEEAKKNEPHIMTKEEFLELRKKKLEQKQPSQTTAASPSTNSGYRKSVGMDFISRIQANANEALGVVPNNSTNSTPVNDVNPVNNPTQPTQNQSGNPYIQEMEQGSGGIRGFLEGMNTNPLLSGIITLVGLVAAYIGLHIVGGAGAIIDIIGLIMVVFGGIYIVKYIKLQKQFH